jgi:aminoglycoside 6'-N-acetyltransferase I
MEAPTAENAMAEGPNLQLLDDSGDERGAIVRRGTRDDLAEWVRLRSLLWPDPDIDQEAEAAALLEGPDAGALFVLDCRNGRLVGFLEVSVRDYAEGCAPGRVPYLEGWYVEPDLRGRGLGAALVEAAEAWARERGFAEIASDAQIDNAGGIAAHRALGFEEAARIVCFRKGL